MLQHRETCGLCVATGKLPATGYRPNVGQVLCYSRMNHSPYNFPGAGKLVIAC